jgi:dephospho-CoA kinase
MFAGHGASIVDTDAISRGLTAAGGAAMPAIVAAFGEEFLDARGALNRARMRAHVFAHPSARRCLEDILHPLIRQEAAQQLRQAGSAYVVLVIPLLAEHLPEYRDMLDRILVVDCDEHQQMERILARPGMTEDQARAILAAQNRRQVRLAMADDVINNRGDLAALAEQVAALHEHYLSAAQGASLQ